MKYILRYQKKKTNVKVELHECLKQSIGNQKWRQKKFNFVEMLGTVNKNIYHLFSITVLE